MPASVQTYNAEVNVAQTPFLHVQFSAYPSQFWPVVRYTVPEGGPVGLALLVVVFVVVVTDLVVVARVVDLGVAETVVLDLVEVTKVVALVVAEADDDTSADSKISFWAPAFE